MEITVRWFIKRKNKQKNFKCKLSLVIIKRGKYGNYEINEIKNAKKLSFFKMRRKMKTSERNSVERTFLSKERNALSEERTILAYIRTDLAVIGVVALILKFYFGDFLWSIHIAIFIFLIFGILIIFESFKIRKLRKKRHELQEKNVHLKI